MNDFLKSLAVSASGLKAQSARMLVISENVANADSLPAKKGDLPYQRKIARFERKFDTELSAETVRLGRVARDQTPFQQKLDAGHPAANANGYVQAPNVNPLIETMDLAQAQSSYQAGLNAIKATRSMMQATLGILRA